VVVAAGAWIVSVMVPLLGWYPLEPSAPESGGSPPGVPVSQLGARHRHECV